MASYKKYTDGSMMKRKTLTVLVDHDAVQTVMKIKKIKQLAAENFLIKEYLYNSGTYACIGMFMQPDGYVTNGDDANRNEDIFLPNPHFILK